MDRQTDKYVDTIGQRNGDIQAASGGDHPGKTEGLTGDECTLVHNF